jgi:hypothetical protein
MVRLVVVLIIAFLVAGAVTFGFSAGFAIGSGTSCSGVRAICLTSISSYSRLWPASRRTTARSLLLGLIMVTIYQLIVLGTFYPAGAVIVSIALAFIPHLLLRGPFARLRATKGGNGRQMKSDVALLQHQRETRVTRSTLGEWVAETRRL